MALVADIDDGPYFNFGEGGMRILFKIGSGPEKVRGRRIYAFLLFRPRKRKKLDKRGKKEEEGKGKMTKLVMYSGDENIVGRSAAAE